MFSQNSEQVEGFYVPLPVPKHRPSCNVVQIQAFGQYIANLQPVIVCYKVFKLKILLYGRLPQGMYFHYIYSQQTNLNEFIHIDKISMYVILL